MVTLIRTPKDMGHALREARKARKMTQGQLAQMSGMRQETISKIENGVANTKLETVFDLLAALGTELTMQSRSKGTTEALEDIF